jgi:hypothetical protein
VRDPRLRRAAAELVRTAGSTVADEDAALGRETIDRALSLLRELDTGVVSRELRAGLRAVARRLQLAGGWTVGEALRDLMARGPDLDLERGA